jgi:hypothetical protein
VRAGRAVSGAAGRARVLHLAGVLRDGMLKEKKWREGFGVAMRAKMGGLREE